jgi:hypothetical protein
MLKCCSITAETLLPIHAIHFWCGGGHTAWGAHLQQCWKAAPR